LTIKFSQAMVFAAGLGKRLRPLTDHTPKPLIPIQNTNCLREVVRRLKAIGTTNIVVNTHHLAPKIAEYVDTWGVQVVYEPTLLETGGGLLNALSYFDLSQPILTINSDIWFYDPSPLCLETLWQGWRKNMDALLLLVHKRNTVGYDGMGDYFLENGSLRYRSAVETAPFVYAGAQLIKPNAFLAFQPENPIFSMKTVWDFLESQKKLYGVEYVGKWSDVGTKEALQALENTK
jgi:MurNAc alpha-1-phosphate uridylyltransferase